MFSIFLPNIRIMFKFLKKFNILDEISDFRRNLRFLTKFRILDEIYDFRRNVRFLTKLTIFDGTVSTEFDCLIKILIFGQV